MADKTRALYEYIVEHATEMTKDWRSWQAVKIGSDYSAEAPLETVKKIDEQNTQYIRTVAKSLLQTEEEMKETISNWTKQTSADRVKSRTSLVEVQRNLGVFRKVYWKHIKLFSEKADQNIEVKDIFHWQETIDYTLDYVMETFTENFMDILLNRLSAQSSLIKELSTPVIPLSSEVGLLPLIGDIDTERAKYILEYTLQQSVKLEISHLIIDLSGVVMVDTMVAHQIFQVMSSLQLIGVQSTLLGIRPEVAQTAVQLGIDFKNINTENSLKKVIKKLNI
ncbi:STAS domain-containing protein [Bacillus sp. ISL-47]|uniref:STAS domain-containing protein n=1 Tax=Bacillus sp. ISL-47 TaxID=2819130 RepID=UPI001BE7D9A8|nr:STAS domain-containing protein [Bacillus sp. ISL-47]MBT2688859.1 STAS domain-containing protein [Bacillus sp. ISL-47]MBT2709117.1 STAS domain-containing protein [Pseudomonas sp. ISL-84]